MTRFSIFGLTLFVLLVAAPGVSAYETFCESCYVKNVTEDWGLDYNWSDAQCCVDGSAYCSSLSSQDYYRVTSNQEYCMIGTTHEGSFCSFVPPSCAATGGGGGGGLPGAGSGGGGGACHRPAGSGCPADCTVCTYYMF